MVESTVQAFDEYFSEDEVVWLRNLADYWYGEEEGYVPFTDDSKLASICANMAQRILDDEPAGMEWILESDEAIVHRYGEEPTFCRLALMGLEYGVAVEDGACANYLGALHVRGVLVPQDYARAVELYELGERKGIAQSAINLGYAYEYGWLGDPDYVRAYMQYAKVASLGEHPEALYKLGDMYSRAKVVQRDLRVAYLLWKKSYEKAGGDLEQKCQGAFRMAGLMEDPANKEWDVPYDPMLALELYQLAERGLRIAVAHGYEYYRKRLREAIEGQERVRALLDAGECGI